MVEELAALGARCAVLEVSWRLVDDSTQCSTHLRLTPPSHPHPCRVFTCARSAPDLEELLQQCKSQGWDVQGCVADVAQAADRQRLVAAVSEAFGGRLQVLFNNVGTNVRKKAVDFTQARQGGLQRWVRVGPAVLALGRTC